MPSIGEQLRRERESHDATLEQISRATRIDPAYFQALERDDFAALPGWAFGKFYIRAYAEVLGFDPERLIAEYENQRVGNQPRQESAVGQPEAGNAWQEALRKSREEARTKREAWAAAANVSATPAAETLLEVHAPELPAPLPAAAARPVRRRAALALAAAGLLVVVAFIYGSLPSVDTIPASSVSGEGESHEVLEDVREIVAAPEPAPPQELPEPLPPVPPASTPRPSHLTVPEFGVGQAVVEGALTGPTDRFAEGSVASFQTLVLGGKRGESIRHVWLREGKRVQSIELKLGGVRWRTHSRKTLSGTGSWTVEARDAAGRVLAQAQFDCVHAGS